MPASKICLRSYQPNILGPAIPTCGRLITASSNLANAYRSGAQSSCKIQSHSCSPLSIAAGGSFETAAATAAPNPVLRDFLITSMPALVNNLTEPSIEPLSTAIM